MAGGVFLDFFTMLFFRGCDLLRSLLSCGDFTAVVTTAAAFLRLDLFAGVLLRLVAAKAAMVGDGGGNINAERRQSGKSCRVKL